MSQLTLLDELAGIEGAIPVTMIDPGWDSGAVVTLDDDGKTVVAATEWKKVRRRSSAVWNVTMLAHDPRGMSELLG